MSTGYFKFAITGTYAQDSSYNTIIWQTAPPILAPYSVQPNDALRFTRLVSTSSEVLSLKNLVNGITKTNIKLLSILNTDAANNVTFSHGTSGSGTIAAHIIYPGTPYVTSDVDPTNDPTIQATTASVLCEIIVVIV